MGATTTIDAQFYDTIGDIGTNTNRRDVSEMLDLWAHKSTPFLNRLSWGADSGGLNIEWITEHLGYGYIQPASVVGSAGGSIKVGSSGLASAGLAVAQINTGALLFGYSSTDSEIALINVTGISGTNTLICSWILPTACAALSLAVTDKLYILGSPAQEGSDPRFDRSRKRTAITNNMTILRKDIRITGSMQATDFHAVGNELRHQIRNRLLEMQREREMHILLAVTTARADGTVGYMKGMYNFLEDQTGNHIVQTSADFLESSVNDVVAELYDNGSTPNVLVASTKQIRKFTDWDRARVRTRPDAKMGGFHVASYLTDVGIEIDLIPMRKFPDNMAFCVETDKIHPRAKKGRKLLLQKLGIKGDYTEWQLISEFSLEFRQYDQGHHGMWSKLNT
jgi:hypothetical protein